MNTATALESISLFFKEGASDKVYHAAIEPKDGGYVVNFAYGRRGSSLQTGTKTQSPVELALAQKVYGKLVSEKTGKGYTAEASGVAFSGTEQAGRVSGFIPQLLNEVSQAEAANMILDPAYVAQEKFYGERRLATTEDGTPKGMNRKGLFVPLLQQIADGLKASLAGPAVIDSEEKAGQLWVFDLLKFGGEDLRALPYEERLARLKTVLRPNPTIQLVPTAATAQEKAAMFERVRADEGEGVVFKRKDAAYQSGRPNSGGPALKFKFTEMASVIVLSQNAQRSVEIGVMSDGKTRSVGNVTIPPSKAVPTVGTVVEVKYLYATGKNGGLLEPVYLGERADVEPGECHESQLKYKPSA